MNPKVTPRTAETAATASIARPKRTTPAPKLGTDSAFTAARTRSPKPGLGPSPSVAAPRRASFESSSSVIRSTQSLQSSARAHESLLHGALGRVHDLGYLRRAQAF